MASNVSLPAYDAHLRNLARRIWRESRDAAKDDPGREFLVEELVIAMRSGIYAWAGVYGIGLNVEEESRA